MNFRAGVVAHENAPASDASGICPANVRLEVCGFANVEAT
jgi:hypothetical protein